MKIDKELSNQCRFKIYISIYTFKFRALLSSDKLDLYTVFTHRKQ